MVLVWCWWIAISPNALVFQLVLLLIAPSLRKQYHLFNGILKLLVISNCTIMITLLFISMDRCPQDCSVDRGVCTKVDNQTNHCICFDNWKGDDCSEGYKSFIYKREIFLFITINIYPLCLSILFVSAANCPNNCSGKGVCNIETSPPVCDCVAGYQGQDCSEGMSS